ncbi:MAG: hypothetical protein Aurels2KO_09970 [Aureliella sp.]
MADNSQHARNILGSESMFKLEDAVDRWKQSFIDGAVVSSEEATELESHLRDSINTLVEQGLSEEEAFIVGTNRLGHPTELQQEYAKVSLAARWRYRLFWMLAGSVGLKAVGTTVSMIVSVFVAAMAYGGIQGTVSGVGLIATMALVWVAAILLAWRGHRYLESTSVGVPTAWIIGLGIILVLAPVITFAGQVVSTNVAAVSWYGEVTLYSSVGSTILNWLVAAACFVALWRLNDHATWSVD